ncbi:uncharacterized protein LOC124276807 [Haliotis rubra]|uniref:uncharacterized protein LOC124276807 n=1 Tax=Haliotis rubra TaxID=36100 RepID=UPI001EE5E0FD|nr:uncharacterized protein LOC124276807 [Haliotis rubra]
MEDAIHQRCVLLQGFPQTPNPHQDIQRLLDDLAGIQNRKICQLHRLSVTNTPEWVILCHSVEDAVAILDKGFPPYGGCQLTVSPCGTQNVPPEWKNPAPEPQGTMHSLSANNGSSSPTENDRLRQDIPEEPSHFESMNYNVENPQTRTRAGTSEESMSSNRNYSSTAGSQQTSHGLPPRHPNDVPYNHPVYHPHSRSCSSTTAILCCGSKPVLLLATSLPVPTCSCSTLSGTTTSA